MPYVVVLMTAHVLSFSRDDAIHARSGRHSTSRHYKAKFPASKAIYSSFEISITGPTAAEYLACEDSISSRW